MSVMLTFALGADGGGGGGGFAPPELVGLEPPQADAMIAAAKPTLKRMGVASCVGFLEIR